MKRLIRKISRLKKISALTAEEYIPGFPENYEHVSIGVQTINVSDIIGMTRDRSDEYDNDFRPIGQPDTRWKRIYERAKIDGNVDFAGPMSVVKDPDEGKYFIYNDGNHRFSVAVELNITSIQAEVTELRERNSDFEIQYDDTMNRINEINEKLRLLSYEQQTLYDSGLSINEADQRYETIEQQKEPLIEEVDKLWSDVEELKQGL